MTGATHRRGPHATSRPAASRHAGAIVTAAPRVGWTLLLKRRHSGCHRGEHAWPRGHRQPYDACADARPPARPGTCSADPSQPTPGLTGLLHSNTPPTPAAAQAASRVPPGGRLVGHVSSPSHGAGESRAGGQAATSVMEVARGHVQPRGKQQLLRLQKSAKPCFSSEHLIPANPGSH